MHCTLEVENRCGLGVPHPKPSPGNCCRKVRKTREERRANWAVLWRWRTEAKSGTAVPRVTFSRATGAVGCALSILREGFPPDPSHAWHCQHPSSALPGAQGRFQCQEVPGRDLGPFSKQIQLSERGHPGMEPPTLSLGGGTSGGELQREASPDRGCGLGSEKGLL